ncbi:MAG: YfhO family protein [Ignavibacteriaceae bacterium]|jgi:hypothetical protein
MAKSKRIVKKEKQETGLLANFHLENVLPEKYHLPAVLVVLLLLFLIFLNPLYFGGKTFQSGDILASASMKSYVEKAREGFTLWNPYIFLGMPAYALGTESTWFNLIYVIFTTVRNFFTSFFAVEYTMWSFYLIILASTSYMLMKHLTKNTLVSLFTAIATSFSTGIIVLLYIGHVTKLTSLCMVPLIFLLLFRFHERIKLLDFFILVIALQLFIQGFHVQIIYYTLLAVGVYYIFYFIHTFTNKEVELRKKLVKSALVFGAAGLIAVAIQSDSLTQVYEYTPYSTRGTKSLVEESAGNTKQSASDYYEYHTNWSFSPGEVMTFLIPSYFGFGNSVYNGPLTENQPTEVNTYFGQMPFVDVAMYMGILIFFLALFAVFTRWKEPLVKFLAVLSLFALFVSFGKNFSVVYDILFNYLPYFDKFRIPSMILVLMQLSFPILAGLGVMKIISLREFPNKTAEQFLKYFAYAVTIIFVLSLLFNKVIGDWFINRVNEYAGSIEASRGQMAQQLRALAEYTSEMFTGDILVGFALLTVSFWAAVFYLNKKISKDVLTILFIAVVLIDLWRIDARGAKYIENPDVKTQFKTPEYVNIIKAQHDNEPFRIFNIKQDGSLGSFNQNSNFNAYFLLEDFYGYSGIKPRAYQDLMDVVGPVNQTLWRLTNVKYIITEQQVQFPGLVLVGGSGKEFVYRNENVLPRFFLANKVEQKPALEVLRSMKANAFDPKEIAFVQDGKVEVQSPDSTTSVVIEKYQDEHVSLKVNASGNNFLVFSDTYMPKGWHATVDKSEVKIYRINHALMGIIVPKGTHVVEFRYEPKSFVIAKNLALSLSSLVILGLLISVVLELLKRRKMKSSV